MKNYFSAGEPILGDLIEKGWVMVSCVGKEAGKTKVSNDASPEKIIGYIIKAINPDKGIEAIESSFGPHQKVMEQLLRTEKWTSIKKEIF